MSGRFIWTLTWGDEQLGTACTDLSAGIVGAARQVLAESREQEDFARRAYASALLGSIAADSHVAELWAKDEPRSPDAYLLLARALAHRVLRTAGPPGPYQAKALRAVLKAEHASHRAAELWTEDPTPWLVRLSLERLRLRPPVLPSAHSRLGPLPGPWDLVEREIWSRDQFNREAGHRLLMYFSPRAGGSNAEMDHFATWMTTKAPPDSPLQLLPLIAELERTQSVDADVQDDIARLRRIDTLRRFIAEADDALELLRTDETAQEKVRVYEFDLRSQRERLKRELAQAEQPLAHSRQAVGTRFLRRAAMDVYVQWFLNVRDEQPIKLLRSLPLSDLMVLAYALYRLGETLAAGNVLSFTRPHATPSPWSRDGQPGDVLERVYTDCQVSLPP
jgi:hypothetical protein